MSHSKERAEKNCLNCNAVLHGRYCSICGQENLEPQETVWHMVGHFFSDITHFDGKFFSSVKYLFTRPGLLTAEYVAGRRASYLNPVRMYIFTSAFFFLVYFSFFSTGPAEPLPGKAVKKDTAALRPPPSGKQLSDIFNITAHEKHTKQAPSTFPIADSVKIPGSSQITVHSGRNLRPALNILAGTDRNFSSRQEYDSLIANGKLKDGFIRRLWERKIISIKERYGDNSELVQDKLVESFRHYVPQMFFLSLPLIALFLKLFYVRRKKFYYTAHFIFTLHLYIFIYLAVLMLLTLNWLFGLISLYWAGWLNAIVVLFLFYYVYRAMRNFYEQGRGKTILKYILLIFSMFFVLMLLTTGMLFFSFFKL